MITYMMNEILCYNSLMDGKKIPGIRISFPGIVLKKKLAEDTVRQMKGEGLVNDDGSLTKLGEMKLAILKAYKDSRVHMAVNNTTMSFLENNKMIIATYKSDVGFELESCDRAVFLVALLTQYPFLCDKQYVVQHDDNARYLSESQWSDIMGRIKMDETLFIQKMYGGEMADDMAMFKMEGKYFMFNNRTMKLSETTTYAMQHKLREMIEMEVAECQK
jgi:hypothetical protein